MNSDRTILVLGGAGLVGSQIVREIARELEPERIVVASLYRGEVREFLRDARREFCNVEFIGAWGDVFVRDEFMEENRRRLMSTRARRDSLYQDLFGALDDAYARSGLVQLIRRYRPNVIVDCINTATAISYQDIESLSKQAHDLLEQLAQIVQGGQVLMVNDLAQPLQQVVGLLAEAVDVLVADGRGGVDAIDDDVGAIASDELGQAGAGVGVVERAEEVLVEAVAPGAGGQQAAAVLLHERIAHEDVAPRADEIDIAELAPGVAQKLAHFAAIEAGDDDALRLQLAGDLADDL